MNTKSKIMVKYAEGVIEMNTTFAKMMQNPLSDEYALLQRTRQDYPAFAVRTRKIKSNPNKDTYKGLTYGYMRDYIILHSSSEEMDAAIAEFDEKILISKCHGTHLRYPTIKKWFLEKYPEIAKFCSPEGESEEQEKDTPKQKVVTMQSENQTEDEAA